ncbi:SNF2-related protein [Paraliobacillus ryukyuensis]|uniref:SNF2-related protein n=1 Tax=Paraliobacillus ryukyuensis TaxID=200904 RepID=UPI002117A779|nr:SNF2-related protein [Paraliobacillus ryukyuensis]
MSKTNLQEMFQDTLSHVTTSEKNWLDFLKFSSKFHKYPFDQALLVYAQNKNVDMLANKSIWSKFKRTIKPKSKAIMVTKHEKGIEIIDYLFDISQTQGKALEKPRWELNQEEKEYIFNYYNSFTHQSLDDKLAYLTELKLSEVYFSIEEHFEAATVNYLDDDKHELIDFIYNSSVLMVLEKMGMGFNVDQEFYLIDKIKDDYSLLNMVGYIVNETSRNVLSDMARLKKQVKLERTDVNGRLHNERGRKLVSRYSESKHFSVRNLWKTSNDISTREQPLEISRNETTGQLDGEVTGNRQPSERESDHADERIGGKESNFEDRRHTTQDETQKSIENASRGNSDERVRTTDNSIVNSFKEPNLSDDEGSFFDEQLDLFNDFDTVGNDIMPVGPSQHDIDLVLKVGSLVEDGKLRIQNQFLSQGDINKNVSFLKSEYGMGGSSARKSTNHIGFSFDSKGITLVKGKTLDREYETTIKWNAVAKRITELVRHDLYLTDNEKEIYQQKYFAETTKNDEIDGNDVIVSDKKLVSNMPMPENYRYSDNDSLYEPGEKTKYRNNVAAIKLLKQVESNNEPITVEQQKVLARYVGWGGLANVFNPDNNKWSKEYLELKSLLTDTEYREAMESTITAYYTDQSVIKEMYDTINRFGFVEGSILDPAMGTGNFFSALPEQFLSSELTGIELDSITGRIAKQLYPNANVLVQGYETANLKDNAFDLVVGNIPFNNISISDPKYDEHNFLIHDYFIAKSLDVVKPGGVIAVITSKGTLDKKNTSTREYIAERSELLGAVRLPNTAFKAIAGTEVTSDILFLQKRQEPIDISDPNVRPNWIDTDKTGDYAIEINRYFIDNPDNILGEMTIDGYYDGQRQFKCIPREGEALIPTLQKALSSISGTISIKEEKSQLRESGDELTETENIIDNQPAPAGMKNYTYAVIDDKLYFNENKELIPQQFGNKKTQRIKGLCDLRDSLQHVINIQSTTAYSEEELKDALNVLNEKYDSFVSKYGPINNKENQKAFYEDDQLPLLLSIEEEKDGTFEKAAIFHKATIRPLEKKEKAETSVEALEMSMNSNMKVDMKYMAKVSNKDPNELIRDLGNRIYLNPEKYNGNMLEGWEHADEYLTGNVRDKLEYAKLSASQHPDLFTRNVEALEDAQPTLLLPGEISYKIGSPWIPTEYYQEFMYELMDTPFYARNGSYGIRLEYAPFTDTWKVNGKNADQTSVKVTSVYGTKRRNGYQIFEDSLNLQDATVRDAKTYTDNNGKEQVKYVVNAKETMIARAKQQEIQGAFQSWLFKDPDRSNHLIKIYNDRYNAIVPRTYNGDQLEFPEMNDEMTLRPHQKDVVARVVSTGKGLLAHEVGAGKTAAMIAAGMKLKQIGAVNKPMYVVMNHTVDQWAKEFLRFYPGANVLITTKKDFQKDNRKRFVSKIATGNYDAIIIGHSQFEKIPLSKERQENNLRKEINSLTYEIKQAKKEDKKDWSIKQLVVFQKRLEKRLKKLLNEEKKDNVIDFEDLGVDSLFVDEAHVYKNLYTVTKLTNVAGIGTSSSQRASDLKMKCDYIQEEHQGKGIVFATGTPVTNSMSELFVMQRYLQPDALRKAGLEFFDKWAGTFGEVVSSLEMTPEGSGYRMKSRFAKFHNLPELMNMFYMVADIQTSEMLNLPVPELKGGKPNVVVSEASEYQRAMMDDFVERSEAIRDGSVDPSVDNMLKVTNEAKLMAIDPRLIDPDAPIDEDSKLNKCISNVYRIWDETKENSSTQMIFCDSGTPKTNEFNVYDDIKNKLIDKGVPGNEIAFIHDAKTDAQRDKLFAKVRAGEVRVLLGSTSKVGTGTNVQDLLIAGHHIDCPWRPADLTQRDGRIVRQGNKNKEVEIYRYVTKGTFDGYLWQIQEQKLRYISQIMTGKNISRSADDTDETVLTAAEVKAVATDNPLLLEKMTLDNDVNRLKLLKAQWQNEKATMENNIERVYPKRIAKHEEKINQLRHDLDVIKDHAGGFSITIKGATLLEEKEAGELLSAVVKSSDVKEEPTVIGNYKGLEVAIRKNMFRDSYIGLRGENYFEVPLKESRTGNIKRLVGIEDRYAVDIKQHYNDIEATKEQINAAKQEVKKPFVHEEELNSLLKKQTDLNLKMEFEEHLKKEEKELKEHIRNITV